MSCVGILEVSLEPVTRSLNAAAVEKLVSLRASDELQERMDELACRCNEGLASGEELAEYDVMIAAANVIAILQAEARQRLVQESDHGPQEN